jgi:hypothetical protein
MPRIAVAFALAVTWACSSSSSSWEPMYPPDPEPPPAEPSRFHGTQEQPIVELCIDKAKRGASTDWRNNTKLAFERLIRLSQHDAIRLVGPEPGSCPDVCQGDRYHVRCNADQVAELLNATAWMAMSRALLELGDPGTSQSDRYRLPRPREMMSLRKARELRRAVLERYDEREVAEHCRLMKPFGNEDNPVYEGHCQREAKDRVWNSIMAFLQMAGWTGTKQDSMGQSLALVAVQDAIRTTDTGKRETESRYDRLISRAYALYSQASQLQLAFVLGHELGHALGTCDSFSPVANEALLATYFQIQDKHAAYCGRRPSEAEFEADRCGLRLVELARTQGGGSIEPMVLQQVIADLFFAADSALDVQKHAGGLLPVFRFLVVNEPVQRAFGLCDYARDAVNRGVLEGFDCLKDVGTTALLGALPAQFERANADLLDYWTKGVAGGSYYESRPCN